VVKRYHVDADLLFVHERFTAVDRHLGSRAIGELDHLDIMVATRASAQLPVEAVTLRTPPCS